MQAGKAAGSREGGRPLQLTMKRGYEVLRDPHLNKGMAFTLEERQQLNIHGLLPPCFLSQDVQVLIILKNFERLTSDLDRYILLMSLQD